MNNYKDNSEFNHHEKRVYAQMTIAHATQSLKSGSNVSAVVAMHNSNFFKAANTLRSLGIPLEDS